MSEFSYHYTLSLNFPFGLNSDDLQADIVASSIISVILRIDTVDDDVYIIFSSSLSSTDEDTLNSIVSSYVYTEHSSGSIGPTGAVGPTGATGATGATGSTSLNVFGTEYQSAASDGESQTNNATFQLKLNLTTGVIPAGNYHISCHYNWAIDRTDANFGGRVQVDSTTVIEHEEQATSADLLQKHVMAGFSVVALSAASHSINLDYRITVGGGNSVSISNAKLEIWRVS